MGADAKVLVAEDDALVGEFLTRALSRIGLTAVTTRTGMAALEAAADESFAAAVIDGILPDMHGIELVRRLVEGLGRAMPICIISGALSGDVAPEAGIAALAKPVGPAKLNTMVASLLEWERPRADAELEASRRAALDRLVHHFTVKPT